MKRFFLIAVETEDSELSPVTVNTDDVRTSVRSLFKAGYDIIGDYEDEHDENGMIVPTQASLDEITNTLLRTKEWAGEDGSRALILIDTQDNSVEDTFTAGGEFEE